MDDLVERLITARDDDHERGCQMRFVVCSCGYDDQTARAVGDAKDRIEALTQQLEKSERNSDAKSRTIDAMADHKDELLARIEALEAEVARLVEANGILEDALQEAGDDYPGSSMQEWCQQQVKSARQALKGSTDAE